MSSPDDQIVSNAEVLISKLYSGTADPAQVGQIEGSLQQLQKGGSGWAIAQRLIDSEDQNARYFAGLTFAIKINQDASSFSKEALDDLQTTLLAAFVKRVDVHDSPIVLRRMSSSLVAFFVHPTSDWTSPILQVVRSLQHHEALKSSALGSPGITSEDLASLSPQALSAVLTFTTILVEDTGRVPHTSQFHHCHETLGNNVDDAVTLMRHCFQKSSTASSEYQNDALQCYQSWIMYARETFAVSSDQMLTLHELFQPLMTFLIREDTFDATAEFFVDMFSDDQAFIKKQDLSSFAILLQSDWSSQQLFDLEAEDAGEDNFLFGQLALAFGSAAAKTLIRSHEEYGPIMEIMHRVTRSQSHETIDQTLANQVCDFWDDYTSNTPNADSDEHEDRVAFSAAKRHWLQAIGELTAAASLPMDRLDESRTSSAEDSLSEFRSRVRSTIEASYNDFGASVLQALVDFALGVSGQVGSSGVNAGISTIKPSQAHLEVILYCLGGLSTSMEYHPGEEDVESRLLERFFTSPMFATLVQPSSHVATALRKRAIRIMADQDEYFCSHGQYLLDALDMLFNSLQQASLSNSAARAIRNLSDSGRSLLVPRVADFCTAAKLILRSSNLDSIAKEDVLGAAGFVVQAMSNKEEQSSMLQGLITMVVEGINHCPLPEAEQDVAEARKEALLAALNQLKILANAVQTPGTRTISLDDDEESPSGVSSILDALNERIASTIAVLVDPREDGQLLEAACRILRVGYKERTPGYFVFSSVVTADLITTVPTTNPRLDVAIETAAAFLSSQLASSPASHDSKLRLIDFVARVMGHLGAPKSDPELAHACAEFVSRLVPVHEQTVSQIPPQYIRLLFSFTIQCLAGDDVLPKKSATNLWAAVVGMSEQKDSFFCQLVLSFGATLTNCLIWGFGGNAARSEINGLAQVYRKLIMKQPHTKQWTEAALASAEFPSERASEADKRRFISQLILCRDAGTTDRVARDFWVLCRGTPTGYG